MSYFSWGMHPLLVLIIAVSVLAISYVASYLDEFDRAHHYHPMVGWFSKLLDIVADLVAVALLIWLVAGVAGIFVPFLSSTTWWDPIILGVLALVATMVGAAVAQRDILLAGGTPRGI